MELSSHFLQISHFLLHKIVTEHLLFRKLCTRSVSNQLMPEQKAKFVESALTFLKQYHDDGDEKQAAVNALSSQWISLQDEIQGYFVGVESDMHGVLGNGVFSLSTS